MVIERAPLEDELGDVLDKALRRCGLSEREVGQQVEIEASRLRDVIDYCGTLTTPELERLARALGLNSVGLSAVASGAYPLPEIRGLPFCLYPLRMPYGIGVANAYIVADCSSSGGVLFDCGTDPDSLRRVWPTRIDRLEAVFLTHHETEHVGGLDEVRRRFPGVPVFGPMGPRSGAGVIALQDDAALDLAGLRVRVWHTPGHAENHHCYFVSVPRAAGRTPLLVSGDLLFAGSVGGCYHCGDHLSRSLGRVFREAPEDTVIAPGHGPLTTIKNERAFNPFVL